jgi:alpha-galactosidase
MLIDSCAAGGKRNDLETMRRAIPLWRTDYNYEEPVGTHAITQGISMWLPYHGGGVNQTDTYRFRSSMTPWFNCVFDVRRHDIDYDLIRRQISQWREVADFFLADFYPLLPYSRGADDWMAWQFHSPEKGAGMIQAFRHSESVFIHAVIPLKGLDSAAQYEVKDLETGQIQIATGSDLLKKGLPVIIQEQPGSVLMSYRKIE